MKEIKKSEFEKYDPLVKYQHPDHVLSGLLELISKIGAQKFLNGAGYNIQHDAFVATLFAYAVRKRTKREWFIQQISEQPDFHIISPTNRSTKDKPMDRIGVEIVQIKTEDAEEAIRVIEQKKLKNYAPEPGVVLLVFLNNKNAFRIGSKLSVWAEQNRTKYNHFSELYCLHLESFSPATTWTYWLVNIFKPWSQRCILSEECNKGIVFPHELIDECQFRIVQP